MSSELLARLQRGLDLAPRDGGANLLKAFDDALPVDGNLAWVGLLQVARQGQCPEPIRALSYALAREPAGTAGAEAIRLWLLNAWRGQDLSTIVNVLTGVERAIDAAGSVPATSRTSIAPFLQACLKHPAVVVKHSVLDLLELADGADAIRDFIDRKTGAILADALRLAIARTADASEQGVLSHVYSRLNAPTLPITTASAAVELRALASELSGIGDRAPDFTSAAMLADLAQVVALQGHGPSGDGEQAMPRKPDFATLSAKAQLKDRYTKQITRVRNSKQQTDCIESAVIDVTKKLPASSGGALVVYGDPQSGKTEMMICLTAKLLDAGNKIIVHLMNDSVDLLMQSLDRFKVSGLAPAPRNASDLANSPLVKGHEAVLFCKKNAKDLPKLIAALRNAGNVIVIDDEADYATPNGKINKQEKTTINDLVTQLLGTNGKYIGVTATPARLNLNNTFNNRPETWVHFRPHDAYTGQDTFFPLRGAVPFRLTELPGPGTEADARRALARFLTTVAHLNVAATAAGETEGNYTFLVHTSGKTDDHKADRKTIESAMKALVTGSGVNFERLITEVYSQAQILYPLDSPDTLAEYVIENASRYTFVVLNSKRDRATAGDKPTVPTCPFTIIVGGNIVSRGVTFPNLLSMYFTRDVSSKLQQDTYIQRARMFGARGSYLPHFELTIPKHLYEDWHRCFVFHRLALETIKNNRLSPVWLGDKRISIASSSSVDRGTVDLNKGEMSFSIFDCPDPAALDQIVAKGPEDLATLRVLAKKIGKALPDYLIAYLDSALARKPGTLAIHEATSITGYTSADQTSISRTRGFIGTPQLEKARFPNAIHHIIILYNGAKKARVFYKNLGGVQFVENLKP